MSALSRIVAAAGTQRARDAAPALALAVAGVLELLVGTAVHGSPAVAVAAVLASTLPLAWRRRWPLLPPVAIAVALAVQVPLDGDLVGNTASPLVALVIALYSAGRRLETAAGLAAAAACVVATTVTRVVADPAVHSLGQMALTLVAVSLPLLVGRWVRGQALLQRRLAQRAEQLARDRDRDVRDAAEEERMRIAGDLQAAIAGRLREIVRGADALPTDLRAGDHAAARASLDRIATTARDALSDVRRVLGILRREGRPAPLTPPPVDPLAGAVFGPAPPRVREADTERTRPPRRTLYARDLLLAAAVLVAVAVELARAAPAGDRLLAAATAVPIAVPLLWRRRHPLAVAAAVFAGLLLQSATVDLDAFPVSDIAAVVCATYAVGAYAPPRVSVAGLVLILAGAAAHAAIVYPGGVVAAMLGGVAAPWTVGRMIRGHGDLTRQSREEAERAERAREREARAAVIAERMRLARELHDAVAHNISVIAIQAGGADGIVERDPERALEVVELIAAVAREALAELGRLTGAPPDGDAAGAGAPPTLAHVGALAARARDAGQPVELLVEGEPAALPRGVDLAAYRIVQEALTNASKHAAGAHAQVVVRYERNAVEVEVADDGGLAGVGRAPARRGGGEGGHGLIGIRERVALYGGTLDAGRRPSGGFRVHARLPIGGA